MKKIIIGVLLIFSGLVGYSQIPDITPPVLFQNQQSYGAIRGIINTNSNNIHTYANRLKDTLNEHNTRLLLLEAGGSDYAFSNGLTLNGLNARLGGTLLTATSINTNGNPFHFYSIETIPTFGSYANFIFEDEQVTLGSRLLSSGLSFLTSGAYLELPSTGLMNLTSTISADVWSKIYQDADGLHIYYNGSPLEGEEVYMEGSGGLKYGGDYRNGFTQYSLVDKGYVDALIGSGTGTGDVKVSGNTVANTVAYWEADDSTLVSDDVVKLYADSAVFTEEVKVNDTLRLNYLKGGDSKWPWLTLNIYTAAVDTGHTENVAWRGLIMALEKPSVYFADQKEVDGHMELRIYYVDSKTKELKYQYGWGHLDVMETQSAYQIFHEISLRYIVEQEEQINKLESRIDKLEQNQNIKANLGLDIKFMIILVVFLGILCFILAIKD